MLKLILVTFKLHHIIYKSNIYSAIIKEKFDEEIYNITSKTCALGRWLDNPQIKSIIIGFKKYHELIKIHNTIHTVGREILEMVKNEGVTYSNELTYIEKVKIIEENAIKMFKLFEELADYIINIDKVNKILKETKEV